MAVEMTVCDCSVGTLRIGQTVQLIDDGLRWKIERLYHFGTTQVDLRSASDRKVVNTGIDINRVVAIINEAPKVDHGDGPTRPPTFSGKTTAEQLAVLKMFEAAPEVYGHHRPELDGFESNTTAKPMTAAATTADEPMTVDEPMASDDSEDSLPLAWVKNVSPPPSLTSPGIGCKKGSGLW
jgi:hypothetical protein